MFTFKKFKFRQVKGGFYVIWHFLRKNVGTSKPLRIYKKLMEQHKHIKLNLLKRLYYIYIIYQD